MENPRQLRVILVFVLVVTSLLKIHFTATTSLSLFSEEAQYWLWSKNLDCNSYSKPMMVAVYNFISTQLLGDTAVAIRINAVLFAAGTAWVVYLMTLYMFKSAKMGLVAVLMLLVMPFFHLASFFHTTDSSLMFFWVLSFYFIWRAIEEKKGYWWKYAGLATMLGILSKNTMVLALPVIFLYFLITDIGKFKEKGFYIYCFIAFLSFVPILMWNWQHDFVTFKHVATLGGFLGGNKPNTLFNILEFWAGQWFAISLFFVPVLFIGFKRLLRHHEKKLLFLILPIVMVWLLFLVISFTKRVEVNWPTFSYSLLPIALAYVIYQLNGNWRKYTTVATVLSASLLILITYPAGLDALGYHKVLSPQKDPLARLAGYRELGHRVGDLLDSMGVKEHFIFSDSYHLASELAFYAPGHPQTYVVNLGSRQNQFDLWPGVEQFEGKPYTGLFVQRGLEEKTGIAEGFDRKVYEETLYTIYRNDTVRVFKIQVFEGLNHIEEMGPEGY